MTDAFAASVGDVKTVDELRAEIRDAMRSAPTRKAATRSAIGSSTSPAANASVELPEVMITNEVEIMRDELRSRLAQQRIGLDQYLAMAQQTPEELANELREPATAA